MVISSSFVILVTIEVEGDSALGSTEISRTYEKTTLSSIYKSSRNLGDIGDLSNQKANATYEVQFDEQGRQVVNVTVIDYAEPPKPRITADDCGDGSNQFTTNNGGVRWMKFPVSYAVDPTNSGVAPTATTNAFIAAFNHFDSHMPGEALLQTTNFDSADIKVRWQFIDGNAGQLGLASWTFIPSTLEITSAAITLDSGDSWVVASTESCGQSGTLFDIQNVGSHELGHVVGLGHVNDNLLTMFPNSFAGETLRRSLGTGDKDGLTFLYGSAQAELSLTRASQTNNFVASKAYYDISFRTATAGAIKSVVMDFPTGTAVGSALVVEAVGLGPGTLAASAGEVLTYTVTNAVNVPALTNIRIQISNINNPSTPSGSLTVSITTRNAANSVIDGPTPTSAYNLVQVGNAQIAPGAVTTTKIATGAVSSTDIAQSFMKRVTLNDDAAGHAKGWDPNGAFEIFTISDSNAIDPESYFASIEVIDSANTKYLCSVIEPLINGFQIDCSPAPNAGSTLNYLLTNLPPNIGG
jgi:Matrixin